MSGPKPVKADTVYTGKGGKPQKLPDITVTYNKKTGKTTSDAKQAAKPAKRARSVSEALKNLQADPKFK